MRDFAPFMMGSNQVIAGDWKISLHLDLDRRAARPCSNNTDVGTFRGFTNMSNMFLNSLGVILLFSDINDDHT